MSLEDELRDTMKEGARWQGSADAMWEGVARRLDVGPNRGRRLGPILAGVATVAAAVALVLLRQSAVPVPRAEQPPISAGRAEIIPTVSGTVGDVRGGYLELADVTTSPGAGEPSPRIPVPAGRWISSTHWRSDEGSLDLFRGQRVFYRLDTRTIVPELQFGKGVVTGVSGEQVTIRVAEGIPEASGGPGAATDPGIQPGERTYRLSARIGSHDSPQVGDQVLIGVFGQPDDLIIWQLTILNR